LYNEDAEAEMTLPPLFYPSPFKIADGSSLGYRLNRPDIDVTLLIYDSRGNQVFAKDYENGSQGGLLGYNKVPFNTDVLGHSYFPAGLYVYILMTGSTVLGKGKFAIQP